MELTLGSRSVNVTLTKGAPKVVQKVARAGTVLNLSKTGLQGPPGSRAAEVGFSIIGEAGGGELLLRYGLTNPLTIDPDACAASIEEAPASPRVCIATLDGQPFATVTFTPGSLDGVFAFEAGALDEPAVGLLRVFAPNDTIADFSITFSGDR